jgi:hypothetical protein
MHVLQTHFDAILTASSIDAFLITHKYVTFLTDFILDAIPTVTSLDAFSVDSCLDTFLTDTSLVAFRSNASVDACTDASLDSIHYALP